MPHDIETEFKLRSNAPITIEAVDRIVHEAGVGCSGTDTTRHEDTYLDDSLGTLASAGIGLRLRENRGGTSLCCKRHVDRRSALFVREENAVPWTGSTPPESAAELPPELRDVVEPFVLQRPLRPWLRLGVDREIRHLQLDGNDLCELAIDRVTTSTGPLTEQFFEIEIEVHDDLPSCERLATRLTERLPVAAADDDKPSHAAHRLGLVHATEEPGPIRAGSTTIAVIAPILRAHLATAQQAEIGVRRDLDPTHLHAMRVALRRLRGVVRMFRDLWSEDDGCLLLTELSDLARRLGNLRDLDVLRDEVPDSIARLPRDLHPAAATVGAWLGERRNAARDTLHAWLRSPTRVAGWQRVCDLLTAPIATSDLATTPIAASAAIRLADAASTVRKLAKALPPDLPVEPVHALRLACKRLRYLGEEFQALPTLAPTKAIAVLTKLQQALGTVCDHEAAAQRLLGWLPELLTALPDPAAASAALGGLATAHHLAAGEARKRATKHLDRCVRKKVWRQFPRAGGPDASLAP